MIQLRKATIDDLTTLKHWDQQAHVIASDPNDDWNWEVELLRTPDWRTQLIAEVNGAPIGFIQIIDPQKEETHYWGEIGAGKRAIDIWIGEKQNLGKGYGTAMMQLALEQCFSDQSVLTVIVDPLASNKKAVRFYEKMGFTFVGKRTFGIDDCAVYAIEKRDWKAQTTMTVFGKYAKVYQDKFMDVDLYKDTFDLFCAQIEKKNANILDVACGPGNIVKYLLSKRPDFKILGVDLSSEMVALAEANNPTARFRVMDCRKIDLLAEKYDAVICGFGLPYLSKEEAIQFIEHVSGLLEQNGVFCFSTMEGDYSQSGFKAPSSGGALKAFIHYHQADYLMATLEKYGFKIINLQRKIYPDKDGNTVTDLLVTVCKK